MLSEMKASGQELRQITKSFEKAKDYFNLRLGNDSKVKMPRNLNRSLS